MNLPFYMARRYLFSKKKVGAINLISGVSMCGVALATLALVCTLSVFNGFQEMVVSFFTAFDPELKITTVQGKFFNPHEGKIKDLKEWKEIAVWSETLEENALVKYKERQLMATIKGVSKNFQDLTDIDKLLYGAGKYQLYDSIVYYGILGVELMSELGTGIQFMDPLQIIAPKRHARLNLANPSTAFNRQYLYSPGVGFMVNQEKYDGNYILTSIDFARKTFGYTNEVSAIELKLTDNESVDKVQKRIQDFLGSDFLVLNHYEQQTDIFRIMEVEKLISYLFLTFILAIACFNVVGSLSILIVDKTEDIRTLYRLGADEKLIRRIFLFEGRLIALVGAILGVILGCILCFIQQKFGLISLGSNSGQFVVDAYPVSIHIIDLIIILITVLGISFLAVWYPVRYLEKINLPTLLETNKIN